MNPRFFPLFVIFLAVALCLFPARAADKPSARDAFAAVKGIWMTEEQDGAVELYTCGNKLCGKFYWLKPDPKNPAMPDLDDKNPDPKLRNRQLCGMQFMGGFTPNDDGWFDGGWIYSPRHGAKFSSALRPKTINSIELRGYVFLPLLGSSQTWTRAENVRPCAFSSASLSRTANMK